MRGRDIQAELERMVGAGMKDGEIADALGICVKTVRNRRYRSGIPAPNKRGRPAGHATRPQPVKKQNLVDRTCHDCKYYCQQVGCCDYIGHTEKRRPCPAGKECTVKEIAVQSGVRSWSADKAWELYDQGWSDQRIAAAVGTTRAAICQWRHRNDLKCHRVHREYHTNWDKARARELYDQGWSDRSIAEAVDVTPSVVWQWRAREGLPRNEAKK